MKLNVWAHIQWIRSRYAGVCVCVCLTAPQGSPHGRCAQWQWSTAGSVWWMCWVWAAPSSSADTLDTSGENHTRDTDRERNDGSNHLSLSESFSSTTLHTLSREQRTGALRFTPHALTCKPYTHFNNSWKSELKQKLKPTDSMQQKIISTRRSERVE